MGFKYISPQLNGEVEIDALNGTHGVYRPHGGVNPKLNWIIAGGETGRPREVRPTDNQWLRSVRDQCKAAGVAFFLKQITSDGHPIPFDAWPEDLKVREFPNGKRA